MRPEEWIKVRESFGKGDEIAFETLYNCLWSKLYAVALNYLRERETTQEVVQETFVKLWTSRSRIESVNDITAFSIRMLQNRIFDYFDKRAVEERYVMQVSREPAPQVNNTHHQIEYEETFAILNCEIEKLPDTTKKVFKLSRFDHFSNEEIASNLRLSVKAVEYHITQSLKHLRIRLGHLLAISVSIAAVVWSFVSRG